ncbi:MAG: hypothetical protein QM796_08950 [Chthoniobacteraceae bacterium]
MAEDPDKIALIAQLAASRAGAKQAWRGLEHSLNVPARVQQSVRRNQGTWLAGAGIAGWLLSRLPARKKKVKVLVKNKNGIEREVKEVAATGFFITIVKLLFTLFRPVLTGVLTKHLGSFAEQYLAERYGFGGRQEPTRPVHSSKFR